MPSSTRGAARASQCRRPEPPTRDQPAHVRQSRALSRDPGGGLLYLSSGAVYGTQRGGSPALSKRTRAGSCRLDEHGFSQYVIARPRTRRGSSRRAAPLRRVRPPRGLRHPVHQQRHLQDALRPAGDTAPGPALQLSLVEDLAPVHRALSSGRASDRGVQRCSRTGGRPPRPGRPCRGRLRKELPVVVARMRAWGLEYTGDNARLRRGDAGAALHAASARRVERLYDWYASQQSEIAIATSAAGGQVMRRAGRSEDGVDQGRRLHRAARRGHAAWATSSW